MSNPTITSEAVGFDERHGEVALAPAPGRELDLAMHELESLEAPGFWDTAAGVGAGTVVGYGVVWGAVAFT